MADRSEESRAVVVDEEALFCVGTRVALTAAGIDVTWECARAHEALRLGAEHGVDLLVIGSPSDMPRAELARRSREQLPGMRIVGLLARVDHNEVGALLALDVDGLLLRSAVPQAVTDAVGRVIVGERTIDPVFTDGVSVDGSPDAVGAHALTARERDVLTLLAEGRSNREIAASLFVSLPTVKTHLAHIYAKLDARNRNEALGRAVSLGLLA